jgi:4-carboxymuconolactone decarboxylase
LNRPDTSFDPIWLLARANGVMREELIEAITHLAFYASWPNAVSAVRVSREVFAEPSRKAR